MHDFKQFIPIKSLYMPKVLKLTKKQFIILRNVQSYFLTWKANGQIPTYEEAVEIVKNYGRHFNGGKLVRKASQPKDTIRKPS